MSIENLTSTQAQPAYRTLMWLAAALLLAMLGLVIHNVREFGLASLLAMSTGTIPMIILGVVLLLIWWQVPAFRTVCASLLIGYGIINLVIGGILTVLPLSFLPFEPEQSIAHYLSHVIYSVTQVPLIWLCSRQLFRKENT